MKLPAQVEGAEIGEEPERPLRVAIVGRPNVGKSSILNALAGEVRSIVNNQSGTTTDAIDTDVEDKDGRVFTLIDTAGIRKRAKVAKADNGTEELSVERALRAMRRADVVAIVIDAMLGATEQDYRIAERAALNGCAMARSLSRPPARPAACLPARAPARTHAHASRLQPRERACLAFPGRQVIVINKWDTVPEKDGSTMSQYEKARGLSLRSVASRCIAPDRSLPLWMFCFCSHWKGR